MRYSFLLTACVVATVLSFTPQTQAQTTSETIKSVQPRMVKIYGAGGIKNLAGYGTGFLVTPQGHIVTIWSHVLDGDFVTVILDDGRKFEAKVLGAEPTLDLAVIKIQEEDLELPHFKADEFGDVSPGSRILGFSNMFKVATGDEPVSVLHGVVMAKTKLEGRRGAFEIPYDGPVYIVDAITNNPGAGGGIITSRDGKLLGMIGREIKNSETNTWINYAIPIDELRDVIDDIIAGRYVARERKTEAEKNPNNYNPLDFGLVMIPDVIARTPAFVDTIVRGSLADENGLKRDDLILFVNDRPIQSLSMLKSEFGYLEAGDDAVLVIRRNDKLVTITMPVEKKPERKKPEVIDPKEKTN